MILVGVRAHLKLHVTHERTGTTLLCNLKLNRISPGGLLQDSSLTRPHSNRRRICSPAYRTPSPEASPPNQVHKAVQVTYYHLSLSPSQKDTVLIATISRPVPIPLFPCLRTVRLSICSHTRTRIDLFLSLNPPH
jgi:hypothetical protein